LCHNLRHGAKRTQATRTPARCDNAVRVALWRPADRPRGKGAFHYLPKAANDGRPEGDTMTLKPQARQKYQRPTVYATGKREKLWKVEFREYFTGEDGAEHSRHKSHTWSRADFTKSEAQAACDKLLVELQQGPPKADGSMTLHEFWERVYLPIRSRRWTGFTPTSVGSLWRLHIQPAFGAVPVKDITKAMVQVHLGKLADAGFGEQIIDGVLVRLKSVLEEALDNDLIPKNPCRKVEAPPCKAPTETRSLTEDEVRRLWDGTEGRDYLFWRILILTGARIGEMLPLEQPDIVPDGLRIDEAMVNGKLKLPKRNKIRTAALPESLRAELAEWLAGHTHRLLFPSPSGKVYHRSSDDIQAIVTRGRAIISDLTFRMCRTTFASLFEGDAADRTSIMGHYDEKFTLAVYRKPIQERRQKSIEELDQRLKVVRIDKKRSA
jgi:integrase